MASTGWSTTSRVSRRGRSSGNSARAKPGRQRDEGAVLMGSRVLLVGMGAREHAVAWKLRQSPLVDELFIAPGNAGTATLGTNVPVQPKDIDGLVRAAKELR